MAACQALEAVAVQRLALHGLLWEGTLELNHVAELELYQVDSLLTTTAKRLTMMECCAWPSSNVLANVTELSLVASRLDDLTVCSRLQRLQLEAMDLTRVDLSRVAALTMLRELTLEDCLLESLDGLVDSSSCITHLTIRNCPSIELPSQAMQSVRVLHVTATLVNHVDGLASVFPNLQELSLQAGPMPPAWLQLPAFLKVVDLGYQAIEDGLIQALVDLPSLDHLRLGDCRLSDVAWTVLRQLLPRLSECRLTGIGTSAMAIEVVAASLAQPTCRLERLGLGDTELSTGSMRLLTAAVAGNYRLKFLELDQSTPELEHSLALNRSGRCLLAHDGVPDTLWPVLLARAETPAARWALLRESQVAAR